MGIGTGTAALIGGVASAGASIGGAAMDSSAASNAASQQSQAAVRAAEIQAQEAQNALNFQKYQYGNTQAELQPWLQSGAGALSQLDYLMGVNPQGIAGTMSQAPSLGTANPANASYPGAYTGAQAYGGRPTAQAQFATGNTFNPGAPVNGNPVGIAGPNPPGLTRSPLLNGSNPSPLGSQPFPGNPHSGQFATGNQFSPTTGASTEHPLAGLTPTRETAVGRPTSPITGRAGGSINPTTGAPNPIGIGTTPGSGLTNAPTFSATPSSAGGFGSLMESYPGGPFVAPTAEQALQSPVEQAQLKLGQQAMEQSAAARGGLLTGGTLQSENQLAQELASTNYQNVYNNALGTYDTNYNAFQNQQANEFNRLSALSGTGQTAAQQLGNFGQSAASNIGNISLTSGAQQGQDIQNAAAANATGLYNSANAWSQGISGATNSATGTLSNLAMLSQLFG